MGLLVDIPKPGRGGNSNDGNTARRFFSQPTTSAEIIGIDEELIKRFGTVLRALSSGYTINEAAFETFSIATARMFVDKYPWYYMPATVQKNILISISTFRLARFPAGTKRR